MKSGLYRGKRIDNGEWVYGYYVFSKKNSTFGKTDTEPKSEKHFIVTQQGNTCEVAPKTLCRGTRIDDKEGNEIYEHDIISAYMDDLYPDERTVCEVVWHDYGWCIKNGKHYDTLESAWVKEFFSIIGNIFDTPERLKWSVHQ